MAVDCTNPDCSVAETGKCVDGFEVGKCPHVKQESSVLDLLDTSSTEESASTPPVEVPEYLNITPIYDGTILTIQSAADVLRSGPARVITVIGPSASGKTTFALCLYDAFQNGPFGKWEFAGSMTLPAFELRSHLSRAKCGNTAPDTERTLIKEGLGFLHLAVHNEANGRLELLISDRSGEHYRDVSDGVEGYDDLHEVSRADYILFFVDGKKLASDERHGVKNEVLGLVRSLVEENVLRKNHYVGVVLTKYDHVQASQHAERVDTDFADLMNKLHERFDPSLANINEFKIAARSENADIHSRYGVASLLEDCVGARSVNTYIPGPVSLPDRVFLRLNADDGGVS